MRTIVDEGQSVAELLSEARHEPVAIADRGRPVAVLVPIEDYVRMADADAAAESERLLGELCADQDRLTFLRAKLRVGIEDLDGGRTQPASEVLDRLEARYGAMLGDRASS